MSNNKFVTTAMILFVLFSSLQVFAMQEKKANVQQGKETTQESQNTNKKPAKPQIPSDDVIRSMMGRPEIPGKDDRLPLKDVKAKSQTGTPEVKPVSTQEAKAPEQDNKQDDKKKTGFNFGKLFGNLKQYCSIGINWFTNSNPTTKAGIGAAVVAGGALCLWCACKIVPRIFKLGKSCVKAVAAVAAPIATYMTFKKLASPKPKNVSWLKEIKNDACRVFGFFGKIFGGLFGGSSK